MTLQQYYGFKVLASIIAANIKTVDIHVDDKIEVIYHVKRGVIYDR